ncbi:type II toxin-antitoxin system Phd/YefM family antitoxin [soil metagenome]
MCYMSETGRSRVRVGVRELRQNLSVYLDRVKAGETLEVTERGLPVAELRPRSPEQRSILDQMIADGRATPATIRPRDIPPPLPNPEPGTSPLSDILRQMREEDER